MKTPLKVRIPDDIKPRSDIISGVVPLKGFIRAFRGKNTDDRLEFFRCGLTRMVTRGLFYWKIKFWSLFFPVLFKLFFSKVKKRCLLYTVDILGACITTDRMIQHVVTDKYNWPVDRCVTRKICVISWCNSKMLLRAALTIALVLELFWSGITRHFFFCSSSPFSVLGMIVVLLHVMVLRIL